LDRLFILLESGSSAVTRRAAAKQIGEVQRLHPHELHNLLDRLIMYIHSTNWETRIAASQAVQAILENVPQWNPKSVSVKKEPGDGESCVKDTTRFVFEKFNLDMILEKGARLMGSEGKEFDVSEEADGVDNKEILIKQRAILNEKLGFTTAKQLGINMDEMVTLEDMTPMITPKTESLPKLIKVEDILNNQASSSQSTAGMSSREMNRAKRKARQNQTIAQSSSSLGRTNSINNVKEEPERKKIKTEVNGKSFLCKEPVPDGTGAWIDAIDWPLEAFCSKLYMDLFSPRWEIRHGSATALRELLKTHNRGGGKSIYMTSDEQEEAHNSWLEDAALRLLCVLALDRFGDFVSDQVVAPVRETCAQVLGTVLKEMPDHLVGKTIDVLQTFIKKTDWEVRHGGILGLKYFVVVREDLIKTYLPIIIKDVREGLLDTVDDVSSVSASTLVPIASHLPKLLSHQQVSEIVKMLWDLLLDQDELAAASNSFMGLLAAILSLPNASQWIEMEEMESLIPRLWPFLSHPTSSVRRSTLLTLKKLTDENDVSLPKPSSPGSSLHINFGVRYWPSTLVQEALRHLYQRVLVEHVEDIQSLVEAVWRNIVEKSDLATLLHAACPFVSCWMCLAMQPSRLAFDHNLLLYAKPRAGKATNDNGLPLQKLFLGGTETIAQDVRERNVVRARFKACKMLGLLSQFLVLPAPNVVYKSSTESPMDCYSKLLLGYLSSRSSLQRIISSMIITFWAEKDPSIEAPDQLQDRLRASLTEYIYYDEIATMVTRLLQEASDFLASLKQYKVQLPAFDGAGMMTLEQIKELCTTATEDLKLRFQLKTKVAILLEERRKSLFNSYTQTSSEQSHLSLTTQSALACAVSRMKCLPEKLNPLVKPLMEAIKREENEILQNMAAESLTCLMSQTINRHPSPNIKIITNLSTLIRSDEEYTPTVKFPDRELKHFKPNNGNDCPYYGIISLQKQLRTKDAGGTSASGTSSRGPGRPPTIDLVVDDSIDLDEPVR
jgi:TATA-binding protein-associated factor